LSLASYILHPSILRVGQLSDSMLPKMQKHVWTSKVHVLGKK
jgi:hypothetical protein